MSEAEATGASQHEHYLADPGLSSGLRERSVRAGAVTISAQALKFGLRLGSTVVLARLLGPEDYGLVALVAAVAMMLAVLREAGLSSATVQRPGISHAEVTGLFWLNVALGAAALALLAALAPAIAWFYGRPELLAITLAFGGIGLVASLGLQHEALLQRRMEFGRLALRDLLSQGIGVSAGIGSALAGAGYWALVIMEAATITSMLAGAWIASPWRPSRPRRQPGLGSLVAFGANVTGANLVGQIAKGLDAICLGHFFGAGAVGLYNRAQNVLAMPLRQVVTPVMSVARPALARAAEDRRKFSEATSELLSLMAFAGAAVVALILPVSDWIILIVLGPTWTESIPIFAALAPFALIEPCASLLSTVLVASGRPEVLLRWKLVSAVLVVIGLALGLPWGPVGVATAFAASGLLLRMPLFMWTVSRAVGLHFPSMLGAVVPAVLAGAASALLAWLARGYLPELDPLTGCLLVAPASGLLYLGICACTAGGRTAQGRLAGIVKLLLERRS